MDIMKIGQAKTRITENHAWLTALVELAETKIGQGDFEAGVALVQVCADFASRNHSGIFASSRLENCLKKLSANIQPSMEAATPVEGTAVDSSKHIVHIMTESHPVGGSSRLVWRWINNDRANTHSVILTAQGLSGVPDLLQTAVTESGGSLHNVGKVTASKMQCASEIRAIAEHACVVVLHIHPHDPLALVALSQWQDRPLILMMNHADHLFWLGASVADHYISFRHSGYDLSLKRRGISIDMCSVIPIPIEPIEPNLTKQECKAQLGVAGDDILCVTIGFSYKFHSTDANTHFVDAILPVFEKHGNAHLAAVGPAREGKWSYAHSVSNGRIQAMGECADTNVYLNAGDVFLMPIPLHSCTAALEAGNSGMPVLAYTNPQLSDTVFGVDSVGLIHSVINTTSIEEFRDKLGQLITDADLREKTGEQTQSLIQQFHGKSAWLGLLNQTMENVRPRCQVGKAVSDSAALCLPEDIQLLEIDRGLLARPTIMLIRHCESLSVSTKIQLWWNYFKPIKSFRLKYSFLEPILLILPPAQLIKLRSYFEHNRLFRRLFLQ